MALYSLQVRNSLNEITTRYETAHSGDAQALEYARKLSHGSAIDVWQGKRWVGRITDPRGPSLVCSEFV